MMKDNCFWYEEIKAQGANDQFCHSPDMSGYIDFDECYKCAHFMDISDARHVLFNIMMEVKELL